MSVGLSIVIPTCGRIGLLHQLLESVRADSNACCFPIEILLVDGSPDDEKPAISALAGKFAAKVLEGGRNIGKSRNAGVCASSFERVLFLDSDVRVRKGTLDAHFRKLEHTDACLGLVEFHGTRTFAWRVVEEMQLMLPFRYPLIASTVPWGPAANISFRKQALLAVGGFDPGLPPYAGEDVDLGFRFTGAGFRISTACNAAADHTVDTWSTWGQNIRRLISYGRADYHLLVRHPERTYIDTPSGLLAFAFEFVIAAAVLIICGLKLLTLVLVSLFAALFAYHAIYALLKRPRGSSFWVHFAGPIVHYLLDLGKIIEALRAKDVNAILRRVRYLDDIIERDWREIAASAWGVYASVLVFAFCLVVGTALLK